MMIFPEGGRSLDGSLRPFKKGAFVMALEKKWPLLPGTIGEPIETVLYNQGDRNALMERARNDIVSHYRPAC